MHTFMHTILTKRFVEWMTAAGTVDSLSVSHIPRRRRRSATGPPARSARTPARRAGRALRRAGRTHRAHRKQANRKRRNRTRGNRRRATQTPAPARRAARRAAPRWWARPRRTRPSGSPGSPPRRPRTRGPGSPPSSPRRQSSTTTPCPSCLVSDRGLPCRARAAPAHWETARFLKIADRGKVFPYESWRQNALNFWPSIKDVRV